MIKNVIVSMRPHQWYKNLVVFLYLIFSLNLFELQMWLTLLLVFILFCFTSGGIYIINDIIDLKKDRLHPIKKNRPIASGRFNPFNALFFSFVLLAVSLFTAYLINTPLLFFFIGFILLNFTYIFWLKNIVVADIVVIGGNFIIRANAGGAAINLPESFWITIITFLLAILLALGKRRGEINTLQNTAKEHRFVLGLYTQDMINSMITVVAGGIFLSYTTYTFLTGNKMMYITAPLVMYCILQYLYLLFSDSVGERPEIIFKDKKMLVGILLWFTSTIFILYWW